MGTDTKVDKIVFYDGFCVVCSRFINLLIKADETKKNKFTSVTSKFAKKYLDKRLDSNEVGKFIIYISNDKIYSKSDAVIQVFSELGDFINFLEF